MTAEAIISLWVSVPVLSVQMTETAPNVSMAGRRRTMAFLPAMALTPIAMVMVRTAGKPSGMAATDRPTTDMKVSEKSAFRMNTPKESRAAPINRMRMVNHFAKAFIWRSRGVWSRSTEESMPLMRPISVFMPVATTSPSAWPAVTMVPLKAQPVRSPSGASAWDTPTDLSTATDSPVRMASCIRRWLDSINLRSAGTRSPASTNTTSPGTTVSASTVTRRPSR